MSVRRPIVPLLVLAAVFVLAGGAIHVNELTSSYQSLPSSTPGAWVVKVGFPVNAVASVVSAGALAYAAVKLRRIELVLAAVAGFQVASLASLVLSRSSSLFGWSEPIWTEGAKQTLAVEIGALVALAAAAALLVVDRRAAVAKVPA